MSHTHSPYLCFPFLPSSLLPAPSPHPSCHFAAAASARAVEGEEEEGGPPGAGTAALADQSEAGVAGVVEAARGVGLLPLEGPRGEGWHQILAKKHAVLC